MAEIVPALLVHNREEFLKRFDLVASHVDRVQWDIMDGIFVDNTTFSDPSVLDEIDKLGYNPPPKIEADLMVSDPENWVERLHHPGVDQLIFHFESLGLPARSWEPIFTQVRSAGFAIGLAAEPETPLEEYEKLLEEVDRFQAMGGKSGFGGQKFNPAVLKTIKKVRGKLPHLSISIDIGVNIETAPAMLAAGTTILVAGSAIFEAEDIPNAIESLRNVQI
uniref:Ribulose-phosphate 3-epimerase n=1 Tax=candidate division WWE3 bacterium TaxID=2053526 RepID=A0A832E0Z9_UNCKA